MGVDLKLLIVDGQFPGGGYSHCMMEFGRHYDLFDRLNGVARTIPGFKLSGYVSRVPDGKMRGECCYGEVEKTPYGEPLTYVSASEFLKCVGDRARDQYARAAVAYVEQLKPDTLIGLYYH